MRIMNLNQLFRGGLIWGCAAFIALVLPGMAAEELKPPETEGDNVDLEVPYAVRLSADRRFLAQALRVGASTHQLNVLGPSGAALKNARTRLAIVDLYTMRTLSYDLRAQNITFEFSDDSSTLAGLAATRTVDGSNLPSAIERFVVELNSSNPELVKASIFVRSSPATRISELFGSRRFGYFSDRVRTLETWRGHSGSMSKDGSFVAFQSCLCRVGQIEPVLCDNDARIAVSADGKFVVSSSGNVFEIASGRILRRSSVPGRFSSVVPILGARADAIAWVRILDTRPWIREELSGGSHVIVERIQDGILVASITEPAVYSVTFSEVSDELLVIRNSRPGSILVVSLSRGDARQTLHRPLTDDLITDAVLLEGVTGGAILPNVSGNVALVDLRTSKSIAQIATQNSSAIAYSSAGYFATNSPSFTNRLSLRTKIGDLTFSQLWDVYFSPSFAFEAIQFATKSDARESLEASRLLDLALQKPPPRVTIGVTPTETKSSRLRIRYTIAPDAGGVAEVRVFHNGKLVMSDGTYKDAIGRGGTTLPALGSEGNQRVIDATTLRTAIPRSAMASESVMPVPILANVNANASSASGLERQLISDLVVRSAPEKHCSPCTGEIEVDVIPGEDNTITVVAFNRDNTIQSLPASASFKSTLPKEDPKLWVLSVGIDKFKDIGALKNARKDAADFACTYAGKQALQKSTGASARATPIACDQPGTANGLFKPENINVIDVQLDDKATKANVLTQLEAVAKRAKPQDTFVLFVASHGTLDANGLFGIVAHDTQCTGIDPKTKDCTQLRGYISSNEILEASKQIKAMKQLMVLDTCHSGGLDNKLSGLYDARMSVLAKNMGLHLYASAQATEAAQDGIPGTNGTFTAQLLAGIRGAAKQDAQGNISIVSLGEYSKQKTIEATQRKANTSNAKVAASTNAAQTPVIQHFGVDAPLARVGR
jgi:uncharacterized caspase-like protein